MKSKAQAEKGNSHLGAKLRDLINELKLEELRNRQMKESEEMQHWIKKVQASNERLDKSKKKMRAKLEKQTIEDHDSEAVDAADALAEVKDEAEAAPDEVAGEVPAKPGYLPPDETPTTTEPPTKVAEGDSEAVEVAKAPDEKIAATKEVATEDAFAEETAATKAASAEAEELPDDATADVEPAEVEEAVTTAKDPDEETVPENKADPTEEAYPANKLEVPLDEFPAAITEAEITKAAITEAEAALKSSKRKKLWLTRQLELPMVTRTILWRRLEPLLPTRKILRRRLKLLLLRTPWEPCSVTRWSSSTNPLERRGSTWRNIP